MTQLTTHFSLEELTHSSTAVRLGIDNTPSDDILTNLQALALGLEQMRVNLKLFNSPIIIDSGYRCEELNTAVHGAHNSAHMSGYAADFICPSYGTPFKIVTDLAATDLQFDQLIMEGTWVHISFDPQMRMQVMTATFDHGIASYSNGVSQA